MRPTTRAMEFYKIIFFSLITQTPSWDITHWKTPSVYFPLLYSITLFSHHQFPFWFARFGFVGFFLEVMDNYKPLRTAEQRAGFYPLIQKQRDSRAVSSSGNLPATARPKMRCSRRVGPLGHSSAHGHTAMWTQDRERRRGWYTEWFWGQSPDMPREVSAVDTHPGVSSIHGYHSSMLPNSCLQFAVMIQEGHLGFCLSILNFFTIK